MQPGAIHRLSHFDLMPFENCGNQRAARYNEHVQRNSRNAEDESDMASGPDRQPIGQSTGDRGSEVGRSRPQQGEGQTRRVATFRNIRANAWRIPRLANTRLEK